MDNFDNFFGSLFFEKDEIQYVPTSTPEVHQLTSCLTGSTEEISVKDSNDLASINLNLEISEIGNDLVSIFNELNLGNEITNNTIITTATTEQTVEKKIESKEVYSNDILAIKVIQKPDEKIHHELGLKDLFNGLILDADANTENIRSSKAEKENEESRLDLEDSESGIDNTSEEISSDEDLDNNNTLEVPDRNFFHLNHEIQNENNDNNFINDDDNVDPLDVIENNNNNPIAEIVLDLRDLIINNDYDWDELDMILSDEDEDYNNNSL